MRKTIRLLTALAGSMVLAGGILLATAVPAFACSCMQPQPMAAYRGDPDQAVFTGFVQAPGAGGVPVVVTRWFQGPATAMVWLDPQGFGPGGASCETPLPPLGTEWIFVAYRTDGGRFGVNLCTPHASAADPAGKAMYADAVATFGEGVTAGGSTIEPTAGGDADGLTTGIVVGSAIGLGMLALGVAIFVLRRRHEPAENHPAQGA